MYKMGEFVQRLKTISEDFKDSDRQLSDKLFIVATELNRLAKLKPELDRYNDSYYLDNMCIYLYGYEMSPCRTNSQQVCDLIKEARLRLMYLRRERERLYGFPPCTPWSSMLEC